MKNQLFNKIYLLSFLFLISCGNSSTPSFSSESGVEALKDKIEEIFGLDKAISSLSFSAQNFNTDAIEQINIFFPENNKNTMWFYSYTINQLYKPEAKKVLKSIPKTKQISAFNITECHLNFKKAIALIEKETDEFSNYHIYSYDMNVDQTSGKIKHNFSVYADKKSLKPTFYGKKMGETLYQFKFGTNTEGNLVSTAGLDAFE